MRLLFALLITSLLASPEAYAQAAPAPAAAAGTIQAENCMVKFINYVSVPAEVEGKLYELNIEEGDYIEKGTVIGVVDDTAAKLALELKLAEEKEASLNAANDVNLKDAVSSEELAQAEAEAYKELRAQGATPYWEMKKKFLEADRAKLRIELAEMQIKVAQAQYIAKRSERQIAEFEVQRRQITAPYTGFIEDRIAQPGEWVQPGSPIVRLIQLDKLRVEGDIDALRYAGKVQAGTPVEVLVYSESDYERAIAIQGTIGFVSSEVDLNNRYRVWVEIDNQKRGDAWIIKPGMRAQITIKQSS